MRRFVFALIVLVLSSIGLCADKTVIALNWVPEPEFGGIYAGEVEGIFAKHGLDVEIKPGGAGAPTWQRVAMGQVDFAVSSADEVVIARANGADIVGIFAIYQTCPQGIMVHQSRGLKSIDEVFKSGTLALEIGLPYGKFLQKKYGFSGVKRVPYAGGIANFLADKNFAQQCFVFSEPLSARKQGAVPQTFLIADSGYNPYTGVIIAKRETINRNSKRVASMVSALRDGWRKYLDEPAKTNARMGELNKSMDAETFAAAAEAQKPLIENEETKSSHLGMMTEARWQQLIDQLADLQIIKEKPKAGDCFLELAK